MKKKLLSTVAAVAMLCAVAPAAFAAGTPAPGQAMATSETALPPGNIPDADKIPVEITGLMAASGVYNHSPQPGYTGTVQCAARDEDVTGFCELVYTYTGTDAGGSYYADTAAPTKVGHYNLVVGVAGGDPCYTGKSAPVAFAITPKPLTITGVKAVPQEFNGSAVVELTGGTLTNYYMGDDVTLDATNAVGRLGAECVGDTLPVTAGGYTLAGADAKNYTLLQPGTLTVSMAEVSAYNAAGGLNAAATAAPTAAPSATPAPTAGAAGTAAPSPSLAPTHSPSATPAPPDATPDAAPTAKPADSRVVPETADASQPVLWAAWMGLSLCAVVGLVCGKRKNRK